MAARAKRNGKSKPKVDKAAQKQAELRERNDRRLFQVEVKPDLVQQVIEDGDWDNQDYNNGFWRIGVLMRMQPRHTSYSYHCSDCNGEIHYDADLGYGDKYIYIPAANGHKEQADNWKAESFVRNICQRCLTQEETASAYDNVLLKAQAMRGGGARRKAPYHWENPFSKAAYESMPYPTPKTRAEAIRAELLGGVEHKGMTVYKVPGTTAIKPGPEVMGADKWRSVTDWYESRERVRVTERRAALADRAPKDFEATTPEVGEAPKPAWNVDPNYTYDGEGIIGQDDAAVTETKEDLNHLPF